MTGGSLWEQRIDMTVTLRPDLMHAQTRLVGGREMGLDAGADE